MNQKIVSIILLLGVLQGNFLCSMHQEGELEKLAKTHRLNAHGNWVKRDDVRQRELQEGQAWESRAQRFAQQERDQYQGSAVHVVEEKQGCFCLPPFLASERVHPERK